MVAKQSPVYRLSPSGPSGANPAESQSLIETRLKAVPALIQYRAWQRRPQGRRNGTKKTRIAPPKSTTGASPQTPD
jgi:hypothetical protein